MYPAGPTGPTGQPANPAEPKLWAKTPITLIAVNGQKLKNLRPGEWTQIFVWLCYTLTAVAITAKGFA